MSSHHQSGVSYDYLWGGHSQYGPGMGTSSGQGLHQKQPAPGIAQSQSQHHFQSHGQYQLNGGVEAAHQPSVPGQANIPLTGNSQYWNRSNSSPQQMSYNSPSMYGTFQSQSHPGVTPSPHHQQQTVQQPAHQPSQQPLLISSPPLIVQGLRSPTSRASETSILGFKHLPQGHSSSRPQSYSNLSNESMSKLGAVSSGRPASSSSESFVDQTKCLLPPTSSKPPCISPPAIVSIASHSATITSQEMQMVHGSKPGLPPSVTNIFGGQHEIPAPPRLISAPLSLSANSSSTIVASSESLASAPLPSTVPVSSLSTSAAGTPLVRSKHSEPTSGSQYRKNTPPSVDRSLSTAFAALTPPRLVKAPSLPAQTSSPVRPPFTLPLVTTQASRTASLSNPPALVSMPPVMGTSSISIGNSDTEQHPPNPTTPSMLVQSSLKSEQHVLSEDKRTVENKRNGKAEGNLTQLDSDLMRTSHVTVVETKKQEICPYKSLTDPPGKPIQASEQNLRNPSTDLEKQHMKSSILSEAEDTPVASTPIGKPPHLKSTKLQHEISEPGFESSSDTSCYYDDKSTYNTPSRLCVSSILEKTSHMGADGSFLGDSTHFDTSQFDSTSCAEEEQSATFDSSGEGSFSAEDSRDDTMESTREEETSEAEVTRNSSQVTEGSMLESSLNTSTQTGKRPVDSSHGNHADLELQRQYCSTLQVFSVLISIPVYAKVNIRENDSLAQEVDPITAAIDAVLANASALSTVVEKPKKMKRARKRDQDGNEAANEEVPSMIMAITGRRGRPPNPDKEKPRRVIGLKGGQARRPGRPPKFNAVDLLSKVDAKLLKRLEAKDVKHLEDVAEPTEPAATQLTHLESAVEPKRPGRRRAVKVEATSPVQQRSEEKVVQSNRVVSARSKAKALAKAQAEAEAAAQAALAAKRAAERRVQAQRRLEERKRQQLIAEELKKPTEDMCLTDHKVSS
ncbi:hypothetical protein GOODEAATRI_012681 [Goodea atripinnis]|uniref:Uncharacterized protein n=1 Tax=Goodea atripinnis TaxID=208336 RepID=A0ABV0PNC0_9TELE